MPRGRLSAAGLPPALRGSGRAVSAVLPWDAAARATDAPFLAATGAALPRSFSRKLATAAAAFSVAGALGGLLGFSAGRFLWIVGGLCLRVMYRRRTGGSTLCAAPGWAAQGGEGKARNFI